MSRGDAIQALDSPYRQAILRVLKRGQTAYSDLFDHVEPDGDDRGRFNYHLRTLRNAELVRLTNGLYGLTPGGEAALVFLGEVSERSEARPRPKQEIRADERGWGRRVGDARRLRKSIHSLSGSGGNLMGSLRSVGIGFIIPGLVGLTPGMWMYWGFLWGPALLVAGGVMLAVDQMKAGPFKNTGVALVIAGSVGFFIAIALSVLLGGMQVSFGPPPDPIGILVLGFFWGPALMVIGIGLLLVSYRRERAVVSA